MFNVQGCKLYSLFYLIYLLLCNMHKKTLLKHQKDTLKTLANLINKGFKLLCKNTKKTLKRFLQREKKKEKKREKRKKKRSKRKKIKDKIKE